MITVKNLNYEMGQRQNGSAWISLQRIASEEHFQCDYFGNMTKGPVFVEDFEALPAQWVIEGLSLLSRH